MRRAPPSFLLLRLALDVFLVVEGLKLGNLGGFSWDCCGIDPPSPKCINLYEQSHSDCRAKPVGASHEPVLRGVLDA